MNMKTGMIALAMGVVAWSGAQADERTFGDGTLPDYLAVFDVDGDGVLSVEEIQAMKNARNERHEGWLARWDINGDGVIDETERAAAQEALRDRIETTREERFAEADTDGDGCLTLAEFSAIPAVVELAEQNPEAPAMIYGRLDADASGCVTLEEFTARLRDPRVDWRTPETYAAADKDADGCLTLAEFSAIPALAQPDPQPRGQPDRPEQPAMLFDRLDANGDGCLSLAEFTAPIQPPKPGGWRNAATYVAADGDADGCLTLAEFSAIPQVMRLAQEHPEAPAQMYAQLDANADRCLSLEEFTAEIVHPEPGPGDWRTEATYVAADVDADGCLTLAEFSAIPAVMRMAQQNPEAPAIKFAQMDENQDECLSLEEFIAGPHGEPSPPQQH